jgi:hypothetical protein
VIDWLARANNVFSQKPHPPTDETDETPRVFSRKAPTPTAKTDETHLSSVSSVPPPTVSEKRMPLAGHPSVNTCADCRHRLRFGTCGELVVAGLLTAEEGFGIVWPPDGHGASCAAFTGKGRAGAGLVRMPAAPC